MSTTSLIRRAILALPASLLAAAGCGGDAGHAPLFPVSGNVVVDGKAAGGVHVRFYPADAIDDLDAPRPTAVSGMDGGSRLGTYEKGDGAPAGRYKVTLFFPVVPPNGSNSPDDLLGGRYIDPARTAVEVTVGRGENRLEPFRVKKSEGSARPRPAPAKPDHDGIG